MTPYETLKSMLEVAKRHFNPMEPGRDADYDAALAALEEMRRERDRMAAFIAELVIDSAPLNERDIQRGLEIAKEFNLLDASNADPGSQVEPGALIYFEDADMKPEVFTNRDAALERFGQLALNWNVHLFVRDRSAAGNERKPYSTAPDPLHASRIILSGEAYAAGVIATNAVGEQTTAPVVDGRWEMPDMLPGEYRIEYR